MLKNKAVIGVLVFALLALGVTSAQALFGLGKKEGKALKAETTKEVDSKNAVKETLVLMSTDKGDIKIKLFDDIAPVTSGNFRDLVEKKFYNGLNFHRLISNFMVQGGCPNGNGTGNYVDPKTKKTRYVPFEYPAEDLSAEQKDLLKNKRGRLAMARTNDPNTASSQFFINLVDNSFLDSKPGKAGYAVFGEVVEGMQIVEKIMSENVPPFPGSDGTSNPVKIKNVELI